MAENILYYGDNLDILRRYINDETIDLVYLDPPFKSDQNYNILFAEHNGTRSASQIKAFEDTWHWDQSAEAAYQEVVESGHQKVSQALQAFRTFLGESDMMAYLAMMAPRLIELGRVLKSTGSIYLHCDPTASHYLKMLMDAIFKPQNFRNEVIWRRTGSHNARRSFGPIHDSILFYSKTVEYYFQIVRRPYMKGHVERRYQKDAGGTYKFTSGGNILTGAGVTSGESGAKWRGFNPSLKKRHWAIPGFLAKQMPIEFQKLGVLDKLEALYKKGLIEIKEGTAWPTPVRYLLDIDGQPVQDIWSYQPYTEGTVFGTNDGIDHDVAWLGPTDPERLGYQTQKPVGILIRIIESSCPKDGVVLDPFCGCGTTIATAIQLKRRWIGIDVTQAAMVVIKKRLRDTWKDTLSFSVIGEPVSLPDAKELAENDPYQFQWWALGLVGARPIEQKKGADKGIDGRLYFHDERDSKTAKTKQIILSVKAGNTTVSHVRDLRGVLDREKAQIGVLITMEKPTKPMRAEAASAGFYKSPWQKEPYPRLQILTIEELLNGKRIDCPPLGQVNVTFKKATKAKDAPAEQKDLDF
ncbi:MAG: restriction endonuclease [Sedimentisphaerales bacterium]|nr:restriction endonuclease [Sedimentisphaerales bacterium]